MQAKAEQYGELKEICRSIISFDLPAQIASGL
jgi:hypothetical protein